MFWFCAYLSNNYNRDTFDIPKSNDNRYEILDFNEKLHGKSENKCALLLSFDIVV